VTKDQILERRTIAENGCWIFTSCLQSNGYHKINYEGKTDWLHRISYSIFKGDPSGLMVLHSCNNRRCFNPQHLRLGNNSDNQIDSVKAGTHNKARLTHCKNGHPLTSDYIYPCEKTLRRRRCIICARANGVIRQRRYQERKNRKLFS
jgi:hypothetical protein